MSAENPFAGPGDPNAQFGYLPPQQMQHNIHPGLTPGMGSFEQPGLGGGFGNVGASYGEQPQPMQRDPDGFDIYPSTGSGFGVQSEGGTGIPDFSQVHEGRVSGGIMNAIERGAGQTLTPEDRQTIAWGFQQVGGAALMGAGFRDASGAPMRGAVGRAVRHPLSTFRNARNSFGAEALNVARVYDRMEADEIARKAAESYNKNSMFG